MVLDAALSQQLKESEDKSVRSGGELLEKYPEVCDQAPRRCQDGIWVLFFVCLAGFMMVMALDPNSQINFSGKLKYVRPLLVAFVVAALTGLAVEMLAKRYTHAFVIAALYVVPVIQMCAGALLIIFGGLYQKLVGVGCILAGMCFVMLVRCCWKELIPPTIQTLQTICSVMEEHPQLQFVAALGSVVMFAWSFLWLCGAATIYLLHNKRMLEFGGDVTTAILSIIFLFSLGWLWGTGIVLNICQMTFCGIFGRWYFGQDDLPGATPVTSSLKVATTSSLGSICFGSFCVAFFQAMEVVASVLRQQAEEEGNVVMCILYCIIQSVLSCIGDIIEWFCSYAYVQCALRGVSFLDGVRTTYALCVHFGVVFIIEHLLINTVVFFGAFVCCVMAALATVAMGASYEASISGLGVGLTVGFIFLMPLRSGVLTFVVCFAEAPELLNERKPELYQSFRKLLTTLTDEQRPSVEMQRPSAEMGVQPPVAQPVAAQPVAAQPVAAQPVEAQPVAQPVAQPTNGAEV